jgi:hypothetical protein
MFAVLTQFLITRKIEHFPYFSHSCLAINQSINNLLRDNSTGAVRWPEVTTLVPECHVNGM